MYPGKKELDILKEKYPIGCRVMLIKMDDPQAPPQGTYGTVRCIDDTGTIMVSWDTGSGLGVLYNHDFCVRVFE